MTDCPDCGAPIVQRTTTGEYWCAVHGRHGRHVAPPRPPLPDSPLLTWDGARWRSSAV